MDELQQRLIKVILGHERHVFNYTHQGNVYFLIKVESRKIGKLIYFSSYFSIALFCFPSFTVIFVLFHFFGFYSNKLLAFVGEDI